MSARGLSINDIDIAHRVKSRNASATGPKPIICKFVRRLARNEVMALRKNIKNVNPLAVGLSPAIDLSKALIVDHLPPRVQKLFAEAKQFKSTYNYGHCWTNGCNIYLRYDDVSKVIQVTDLGVIQDLEMANES